MTFAELKKYALDTYYPALFIERVAPHHRQLFGRSLSRIFLVLFFVVSIFFFIATHLVVSAALDFWAPKMYGLFLIFFSIWTVAAAFQAFYYSFYFKGLSDEDDANNVKIGFELAHIIYLTSPSDLTKGFLKSREGWMIGLRANISQNDIDGFLNTRQNIISSNSFSVGSDLAYITVSDYASALFDSDKGLSQFLFAHGIQKKDFLAITEWVVEGEAASREKQRWWVRDRLGRIPGIGKNWSYGQIFNLEQYSREIPETFASENEVHSVYGADELKELEAILVRARGANALLVGNDTEGKIQIISRLNYMIDEGTVLPQLEHKRLLVLDTDLLLATMKTKGQFETEFLNIMNEAANAGNMIICILDMPSFIGSADAIGSNVVSLIDPYLTSRDLHVIALSDVERFHSSLERNSALMQRFEKILISEIDSQNTVRVLQNEIVPLEAEFDLLFTYPALTEIADAAEKYFPGGIMPDKAVDLLLELAPEMAAKHKIIIEKEDVLELVHAKTGIPVGKVEGEEREKLLDLENILHQRIVGQDEAVVAIANAVRRARSGINNPSRPLGSFLFLGPTGVGKTETTKALAEVFFGAEAKIERLDMSEYAGADALQKIIGSSFDTSKPGVLTTLVREHPYGVLLLDEFEKTTTDVMNLFLQILDEGFFSDATGKKVTARSLLIIATSNAGSDLIWQAVKEGNDLSHAKELIIDSVIKAHIFKPELLNRFDGVIIFHPLATEHLEKIARLQLARLKTRLAPRGINLLVNDDLVSYVMKFGVDPKFGARPMNRAIQDKVEQIIAEKMIRGDLGSGSEVALTTGELSQ